MNNKHLHLDITVHTQYLERLHVSSAFTHASITHVHQQPTFYFHQSRPSCHQSTTGKSPFHPIPHPPFTGGTTVARPSKPDTPRPTNEHSPTKPRAHRLSGRHAGLGIGCIHAGVDCRLSVACGEVRGSVVCARSAYGCAVWGNGGRGNDSGRALG
jgi:hypothetical protein